MIKHRLIAGLALLTIAVGLGGCAKTSAENTSNNWGTIVKEAKKEGTVKSVGMPNTWANWGGTWNDLKSEYHIFHSDTDMSSAQELQNSNQRANPRTPPISVILASTLLPRRLIKICLLSTKPSTGIRFRVGLRTSRVTGPQDIPGVSFSLPTPRM